MQAAQTTIDFTAALNEKHGTADLSYDVQPGRVYDKITSTSYGQKSVHAFVEKATGKLVKAATWKAPQKDKDGLAYRWDISTPEGMAAAVEASDRYGSYLYKR